MSSAVRADRPRDALAAACDALDLLVLVVEAAPDGTLRCVAGNLAFERRFGDGRVLDGRDVLEVVGEQLSTTFGAGTRHEVTDERGRSLSTSVTETDGESRSLVWSAWDRSVDARRHADLRDRNSDLQSEKTSLEQSNFDLGQFAYVASHDLAEPLRMVTSYLELLSSRYGADLDERAHRYIGFASEGAIRMRALIEDLLALARVASAEAPTEAVDLEKVLAATVAGLGLRLREVGGSVEHSSLPVVVGNKGQLSQLLTNLVGNALKFADVDRPMVRVSAGREGDRWRIDVDDNGPGVPEPFRHEVFDMFRRLRPRSDASGTGIGLAIAKKVVERHGGEIAVTDSPAGGARFWFTLPATESSS